MVKFNTSHLTKEVEYKDGIQVNASYFHKDRFHPTAMLQLVADSEAVISQLQEIHNRHGDVVAGIFKEVGHLFSTVGKTGSKLIRSIGGAFVEVFGGLGSSGSLLVKSLTNGTATVMTSTASMLTEILPGLQFQV